MKLALPSPEPSAAPAPRPFRPAAAEWIAMAFVLAAGAWLRFRDLAHMQFGLDAVHMLRMAERMAQGEIALTGIPSSKGVMNPPLAIWLLWALRAFLRAPESFAAATAAGSLAAIAGTWVLARRWLSPEVALAAAALFAVGTWPVLYSRFLWQQNFIPPMSVALLACVWEWTAAKRAWALFGAIALAALIGQLHMIGLAAFATIAVAGWMARAPFARAPIAAGAAFTIAIYAPFAWAVTHGHFATRQGAHGFFVDYAGSPFFAWYSQLSHSWLSFDLDTVLDAFAERATPLLRLAFAVVPPLAALLALAGLAACAPAVRRERVAADPVRGTLFVWSVLPVVALALAGIRSYPHYVIPTYPAPWLLIALGLERIAAWRPSPRLRIAAAAALAFCLVFEATYVRCVEEWIATDRDRSFFHFGPTLADERAVAAAIGRPLAVADAPAASAPPKITETIAWLAEQRPEPATPMRWLVLDLGDAPLSDAGAEALVRRGGRRIGPVWICPWPSAETSAAVGSAP